VSPPDEHPNSEVDPLAVRKALLADLLEIADGDVAMYHDIVFDPADGVLRVGHMCGVGHEPSVETWLGDSGTSYGSFEFDLASAPQMDGWDRREYDEVPPSIQQLWDRVQTHSVITFSTVDGDRFAGQLAVFRRTGRSGFDSATLKRCQSRTDTYRTGLRSALRCAARSAHGCSFVLKSDGSSWMRGHGSPTNVEVAGDAVQSHVGAFVDSGEPSQEIFDERTYIRLMRLTGLHDESGVLVTAQPVVGMTTPKVMRLSRVQREVVAYAVSGATAAEIAAAMQRSPHTIRDHIKNIYQTLDVANRAELTSLVAGLYEYSG
jgi:DNA-binding CsgD family transcriptional regulator